MGFTRHRRHRWLLSGLLAALALAAIAGLWVQRPPQPDLSGPPAAPVLTAQVLRVIDGDTIVVATAAGDQETVRYIGIDAPEIRWDAEDPRAASGPGWAARIANQRLVAGRRVQLELDAEERDAYGRLLAYVYVDDVLVNARLVQEGLAVALVVPPNVARAQLLVEGQRAALRAGRGLWGEAAGRVVDARAAGEYVGKAAAVEGVVERAHVDEGSGLVFLNFGPNPRRDFVVVIRPPFTALFASPLPDGYQGRRVRVRGVVEDFRGQPQIVVQLPEQIEVID